MSAAVSVGTPVGESVAQVLSQGKAVTHELYAQVLKEAMGNLKERAKDDRATMGEDFSLNI